MILRKIVELLSGAFCLLVLASCEVSTSVIVSGGPSFSFDGSGRLVSFIVYGPRPGHRIATPLDAKSVMWSIQPASGSPHGIPVVGLDLVYGKVPEGYVQAFPSSAPALPLADGHVYAFAAETTGASGIDGFFYMDRGTPVRIDVPGLCESESGGDVKPVRCHSGEPCVEPNDIEEFVRERRVQQ